MDIDFSKLPKFLEVDVKKGETGVLIAELPKYGIFTEGDDLNELFINVNDLIYTFFDIPKKYQDKIAFIPNIAAREILIKTSQEKKVNQSSQLRINTFYTEDLCRSILSA